LQELRKGRFAGAIEIAGARESAAESEAENGAEEEVQYVGVPTTVFGKPNCRCENNIKMYLSETEWKSADRVHLAEENEDRYQ
jgi:hypothetical protein